MKYFTQPPIGTPLNLAHPLNQGLVGYWPMVEGAGINANDSSGKGNHGILTNMVQGTTNGWSGGNFGRAIMCDGINDYVDLGAMRVVNGLSRLSIFAWIKITTQDGRVSSIVHRGIDSPTPFRFSLSPSQTGIGGDNDILVLMSQGVNTYGYTTSDVLKLNQWAFVGFVFDGSKSGNSNRLQIYANGISIPVTFVGTIPSTVPADTGNLFLGHYTNFGFFPGFIQEVRIYSRNISSQEIQQLYTDPFCMYEQKNNFRWFSTFDRKGSFFFSRL